MSALAPDDPRHGTLNGYSNLDCRCEECRAAWRVYKRAANHRVGRHIPWDEHVARLRADAEARDNHGTTSRYKRGCRCEECRTAATAYRRARRQANPEQQRAYDRARYRSQHPFAATRGAA